MENLPRSLLGTYLTTKAQTPSSEWHRRRRELIKLTETEGEITHSVLLIQNEKDNIRSLSPDTTLSPCRQSKPMIISWLPVGIGWAQKELRSLSAEQLTPL